MDDTDCRNGRGVVILIDRFINVVHPINASMIA
jgi:hypothetical protein